VTGPDKKMSHTSNFDPKKKVINRT
jgi:hypothetical protein